MHLLIANISNAPNNKFINIKQTRDLKLQNVKFR